MFTSKVVCLIFFLGVLICLLQLSQSELREGDPGVCIKWSTWRDYNLKTEKRFKHFVCCDGWRQMYRNDTCVPLCKRGCWGGVCVGVNKCECTPPLVLVNFACEAPRCPPGYFNDPIECKPSCAKECVYGTCVAHNKCECHHGGFVALNNTHCAPVCPPGYYNDPIECTPKCESACVYGKCVAPNRCECINDDFVPLNETHCAQKPRKGFH